MSCVRGACVAVACHLLSRTGDPRSSGQWLGPRAACCVQALGCRQRHVFPAARLPVRDVIRVPDGATVQGTIQAHDLAIGVTGRIPVTFILESRLLGLPLGLLCLHRNSK
jgi:hypothetical protein